MLVFSSSTPQQLKIIIVCVEGAPAAVISPKTKIEGAPAAAVITLETKKKLKQKNRDDNTTTAAPPPRQGGGSSSGNQSPLPPPPAPSSRSLPHHDIGSARRPLTVPTRHRSPCPGHNKTPGRRRRPSAGSGAVWSAGGWSSGRLVAPISSRRGRRPWSTPRPAGTGSSAAGAPPWGRPG